MRMKLLILILSFLWFFQYLAGDSCNMNLNGSFGFLDVQRQGCCSWHKGVCGCSNGRTVCCDGTYSPICTCN